MSSRLKEQDSFSIALRDSQEAQELFGEQDSNLRLIEGNFDVKLTARGCNVAIIGNKQELDQLAKLFDELLSLLRKGHSISSSDIKFMLSMLLSNSTFPDPNRKTRKSKKINHTSFPFL